MTLIFYYKIGPTIMDIEYWQEARQKSESFDVKLIAAVDPKHLNPAVEPIYAHKKFLQRRSTYFQTVDKWNSTDVIVIPGISRQILSLLIKYLYSGGMSVIGITRTNALDIWLGAHTLMLNEVKAVCDSLIAQMPITIENCCQLLIRGCKMKSHDLIELYLVFILVFLNEFIHRPEFLLFSCHILQTIIKRGLVAGNHPKELLQMIVNWVNYGGQERMDSFLSLIELLPFQEIGPTDRVNMLMKGLKNGLRLLLIEKLHARKEKSENISRTKTDSVMVHLLESISVEKVIKSGPTKSTFPPSRKTQIISDPLPEPRTKNIRISDSRSASQLNFFDINTEHQFNVGGVIYFIAESSQGFQLVSFNLKTFRSVILDTFKFQGKKGSALVYHDGLIYIIGGAASTDGVELDNGMHIYDLKKRTWTTNVEFPLPKMLEPRYQFNCAILNNEIYAVGGCQRRKCGKKGTCDVNINCVEKLKLKTPDAKEWQWENVDFLTKPRSDYGVSVLDGKIFVIGGNLTHGPTATVEAYEPDSWDKKATLKRQLMGSCAVTVKDNSNGCSYLYALGGGTTPANKPGNISRIVQMYDPSKDTWEIGPPMIKPRQYGSAVFYQNCIYAIGGDEEATIEKLKVGDKDWTMVEAALPKDGIYRSIAFQP